MRSRVRSGWFALALLFAVVLTSGVEVEGQCSMCRTLLATPEGQRLAGALRSAIWVLLAAPFGVFAVIAVAAIRSRKRLDRTEPDATRGRHDHRRSVQDY